MCGIVGVVGKPARDIILNALTNLEYRGYDSAGMYLNDLNGNEYLTKAVGRISNLKEKLTPDEQGLVGIGILVGLHMVSQQWIMLTLTLMKLSVFT